MNVPGEQIMGVVGHTDLRVWPLVDILLPTDGKKLGGLRGQTRACLTQSDPLYNIIDWQRLNVLADGCIGRVNMAIGQSAGFYSDGLRIIEVPNGPLGHWGHPALKWAVENLELAEWIFVCGDDDCILPWAIDKLYHAAISEPGLEMVVGVAISVTRETKAMHYVLGNELQHGLITGSCCLYRTAAVREVGYGEVSYAEDWELIRKLKLRGRWKKIPTVVYMLSGPMK